MPSIIVPSRRTWTRQPQGPVEIDPLYANTPVTWTPANQRQMSYNGAFLVTKTDGTSNPGRYVGCDAVSYTTTLVNAPAPSVNTRNFSLLALLRLNGSGGAGVGIRDKGSNILLRRNGGNWSVRIAGGDYSGSAVPLGVWLTYILNSSPAGVSLTVNGVTALSGAAASSATMGSVLDLWSDSQGGGQVNMDLALLHLLRRPLTPTEIRALSANPWAIHRPRTRRTIISLGASADLEISATLGTALASGYDANINLSREIAAQTATAIASGNAASVDLRRNVSATVATATASGFNANVNRQLAIDATLATANASGYSVGVDLRRNVSATIATATALGNTTNVNLQRQIIATLGTASAIGYDASIETVGVTNIQATLGMATASGYSANINLQKEIAANLSVASAIGYPATIDFASVLRISATLGTSSASGYVASIDRQTGINATLATAGAFGYDAIINSAATKFTPIESAYSALDIAYNYNVLSIDKDYNIWQVN